MLFDLDITEGEWFQFFGSHIDEKTGEVVYDDPVGDAKVQIRSMKPFFEERVSKRKNSSEFVLNTSTRQMERISFIKEQTIDEIIKEREDAYDYAITGIEGFKDKRTKAVIECTCENKIKLMKNPIFDRFFAKCQQLIEDSIMVQKEGEEKNSLNG